MICSCGLSNYSSGFFHLINHAFFKALLFLSAGSIIHAIFDEQDMRKMGGLKNLTPFTYSMMYEHLIIYYLFNVILYKLIQIIL
jgi:NADH-ubiquinone oxidoreductase chain 5